MKWCGLLTRALLFVSQVFSLALPSANILEGLLVSANGDTLSYSMQSLKPASSIPGTLKPKIQDGRMIMEYQYRWTACRDVDQSVIVKGDSVLVQHFINGSCIKAPQVYAFRAEVNGLRGKNFTLAFQQVKAFQNKCNPPIRSLASVNVISDSIKPPAHDSPAGTQGKLDFHTKMAWETFRSGFAKLPKSSDSRFQIRMLEDSLIEKHPRDTLILQVQSGELEFQSTYRKSQCEDFGIGIRTSGDTIQVIHQDRGDCDSLPRRYGVRGKISDLPKGKYIFRVQARERISGICENDAGILLTRELVVP